MTITEDRPADALDGPVLPVEPAPPRPAPEAAADGPPPLRYGGTDADDPLGRMTFVFDLASWSVMDTMAVRVYLGYKTREDFDNTARPNPEILQVGQAWLILRDMGSPYADLPAKELGRRIKGSQFVAPDNPKSQETS